jgi:hypothetical protein
MDEPRESSGRPSVSDTEQFWAGTPAYTPALSHADGAAVDGGPSLRCRECNRLRHASPRHEPSCSVAWRNCPGCVYPGAEHLASCPIGAQLKRPEDTCCTGVDMPTIGVVHSHDCRISDRPVLRSSRTYPAVTTVDEERGQRCTSAARPEAADFAGEAGLFGQLLFAARALGHSRVVPFGVASTWCLECDCRDVHASTCRTGRVLNLVDRICAVSPLFPPVRPGGAGDDLKSQLRASIELVDRQNGGAQ